MESYRGYCSYNLRESRASVLTKAYHTEHILNFWITSIRTTPIDGLYREDSAALSYCRIESSFVSGRVVSHHWSVCFNDMAPVIKTHARITLTELFHCLALQFVVGGCFCTCITPKVSMSFAIFRDTSPFRSEPTYLISSSRYFSFLLFFLIGINDGYRTESECDRDAGGDNRQQNCFMVALPLPIFRLFGVCYLMFI